MSQPVHDKLHIEFIHNVSPTTLELPRVYTLTHSDSTGEMFLSIGRKTNLPQISGLYTRFMRDEVVAEWKHLPKLALHVYCHVSGGIVFGTAGMREQIFRQHLPMVLEVFRYADRELINKKHELDKAAVIVHFKSNHKAFNKVENWGNLNKYKT